MELGCLGGFDDVIGKECLVGFVFGCFDGGCLLLVGMLGVGVDIFEVCVVVVGNYCVYVL